MHRPKSKTVRTRGPHREVRRIPVGTRPDLAALVSALGLVPGVDSFVLLDGDGWRTRMLAFDPEHVLSVEGDSPFEEIRSLLTLGEYPAGCGEGHIASGPTLFGYLSYDAARSVEYLPNLAEDDLRLPVARFILPRYVIGVSPEGTWASVPVGHSTQTSYLRPSISRRCSQTRLLTRPRARFGPRAPPLGARGTCGQWSG